MSTSPSTTSQIDNDLGGLTENELLEELSALASPVRKPGGVTAAELAERVGSIVTARRILFGKEKTGELYSEKVAENGHMVRVWYRKL